jgi:hypothetical protein
MRREDLEIGGMYLGPDEKCYEIRDLTPGWKIDNNGEWWPDNSTRTRYNRSVRSSYKVNLFLKAIIHEGETQTRAVVDPRNLKGPWQQYVNEREIGERHQQQARVIVKALMATLRTHPAYGVRGVGEYAISKSGASVTIPSEDLILLLELAHPVRRPTNTSPVPQIDWVAP